MGVTTMASATLGSVTETRLRRSVVLISSDLPTITRSGAAPWDSASAGPVRWLRTRRWSLRRRSLRCGLPWRGVRGAAVTQVAATQLVARLFLRLRRRDGAKQQQDAKNHAHQLARLHFTFLPHAGADRHVF